MALDAPQGTFDIYVPRHHVLTGDNGELAIKEWGQQVWTKWEEICSAAIYWKKVGVPGIWTTNEDDKRWFLYNLLTAGQLHILIKRAGSGSGDFEPWQWSSQKAAFDIVTGKLLSQSNSRKKTPCGNTRIREEILIETPLIGFPK